jgi:hypothetical protein
MLKLTLFFKALLLLATTLKLLRKPRNPVFVPQTMMNLHADAASYQGQPFYSFVSVGSDSAGTEQLKAVYRQAVRPKYEAAKQQKQSFETFWQGLSVQERAVYVGYLFEKRTAKASVAAFLWHESAWALAWLQVLQIADNEEIGTLYKAILQEINPKVEVMDLLANLEQGYSIEPHALFPDGSRQYESVTAFDSFFTPEVRQTFYAKLIDVA